MTKHTTHTPGPWIVGTNGDKCAKNHAICAGPHVLAKVYGTGYPIGEGWAPQSQANAHLIAAAPDLLAALKALATHEGESEPNGIGLESPTAALEHARALAVAAIARAEGRG